MNLNEFLDCLWDFEKLIITVGTKIFPPAFHCDGIVNYRAIDTIPEELMRKKVLGIDFLQLTETGYLRLIGLNPECEESSDECSVSVIVISLAEQEDTDEGN